MTNNSTLVKLHQEETLSLYAVIMEEVKVRISAIDIGLGSARALLPPLLTSEYCFVQIRMICELIAFGCLVAHGDITKHGNGKRLLNTWSAETIMTELGKLHPHFFPRPVKLTFTPSEGDERGNIRLEDRLDQLTKDGFLKPYGRTGGALHRGTLNKITGRKPSNVPGDKGIREWSAQLGRLFNDHHIPSWDNLRQLICIMSSSALGGRVQVILGESVARAKAALC